LSSSLNPAGLTCKNVNEQCNITETETLNRVVLLPIIAVDCSYLAVGMIISVCRLSACKWPCTMTLWSPKSQRSLILVLF